jgi:uncharacterized membrane protein
MIQFLFNIIPITVFLVCLSSTIHYISIGFLTILFSILSLDLQFCSKNPSATMVKDCTEVGPNCPADGSSLSYPPSLIASAIFTAIFAISLLCHSGLGLKYKTWSFMGVYCTGSLLEVIGYVGRALLHNNPYNLNTSVSPSHVFAGGVLIFG